MRQIPSCEDPGTSVDIAIDLLNTANGVQRTEDPNTQWISPQELPNGRRFRSVKEAEEWAVALAEQMADQWPYLRQPIRAVTLGYARKRGWNVDERIALCREATRHGTDETFLILPKWALCELVVTHELAHAAVLEFEPTHGPVWCRAFVSLLDRGMGFAVADFVASRLKDAGATFATDLRIERHRETSERVLRMDRPRNNRRLQRLLLGLSDA